MACHLSQGAFRVLLDSSLLNGVMLPPCMYTLFLYVAPSGSVGAFASCRCGKTPELSRHEVGAVCLVGW